MQFRFNVVGPGREAQVFAKVLLPLRGFWICSGFAPTRNPPDVAIMPEGTNRLRLTGDEAQRDVGRS